MFRPICGASGLRGPCKQPANSCPYHQRGLDKKHDKKMPDRLSNLVDWLRMLQNSINQLWQPAQVPAGSLPLLSSMVAEWFTTRERGDFQVATQSYTYRLGKLQGSTGVPQAAS